MRDIRVAAVQFEAAPRDKEANLTKVKQFVARAFPINGIYFTISIFLGIIHIASI